MNIKLFFSFFILLMLNSVSSNKTFQCGTQRKKVCAIDNTCCYDKDSSDGFKCFPIMNGNCCRVGKEKLLTVCPDGSICDTTVDACVKLIIPNN
jgi:hypothetical protein